VIDLAGRRHRRQQDDSAKNEDLKVNWGRGCSRVLSCMTVRVAAEA